MSRSLWRPHAHTHRLSQVDEQVTRARHNLRQRPSDRAGRDVRQPPEHQQRSLARLPCLCRHRLVQHGHQQRHRRRAHALSVRIARGARRVAHRRHLVCRRRQRLAQQRDQVWLGWLAHTFDERSERAQRPLARARVGCVVECGGDAARHVGTVHHGRAGGDDRVAQLRGVVRLARQ
eukprot:71983-Chlamydomonas_euryale.AAC.1